MSAAAIVLAGGDGTRLRALTRPLTGDDRPKQFCALLGEETLLAQTRRRAARLVAPERTLLSVTRTHEPYYRSALADVPRRNVVAQPRNRGTAWNDLGEPARVLTTQRHLSLATA
jgi:mannose-1-phosphate guanylyltransferase